MKISFEKVYLFYPLVLLYFWLVLVGCGSKSKSGNPPSVTPTLSATIIPSGSVSTTTSPSVTPFATIFPTSTPHASPTDLNSNIISLPIIIDNQNYQLESAYFAKSFSTSANVYGVIKIKYIGQSAESFITTNLEIKNSANQQIVNDEGVYLSNSTCCGIPEINDNITSFATPQYNELYYLFLFPVNHSLADFSKGFLRINSTPFIYSAPIGKMEWTNQPYRFARDSWRANLKNSGTIKVYSDLNPFLFRDSFNRTYKWQYPSISPSSFQPGQSGTAETLPITPDYLTTLLEVERTILGWYLTSDIKIQQINQKGRSDPTSIEQYNLFIHTAKQQYIRSQHILFQKRVGTKN